jgi:integrase
MQESPMKLTRANVSALALPEGKSEAIYWDDDLPGFGVRVRGEQKRYICQYRIGHQQRRQTIGDVRRVELETARKAARATFAKLILGTDPMAEKARARQEATAARVTLASTAARYIRIKENAVRAGTLASIKLCLQRHWAPLGNRPLDAITRADVAARLQELAEEKGPVAAKMARMNLSALFAWSMREGLCDSNPVINTNNPAEGARSRDRILTDAELKSVWFSCDDNMPFSHIVRLLILTGLRRNEIGGLRWSEINADTGVVLIAAERVKNGRAHQLTLPLPALEIIRALPRRNATDRLFPSLAWDHKLDGLRKRLGDQVEHFSLHDLRRTFRSGLARIGVRPDIAERCIGHTQKGIMEVYDRHAYCVEIRDALERWADHVLNLLK